MATELPITHGVKLINDERHEQLLEHGYDEAHDRQHVNGELLRAAVCYMRAAHMALAVDIARSWPWNKLSFKPHSAKHVPTLDDRIYDLKKAGAFIAAEIDRYERLKLLEIHLRRDDCGACGVDPKNHRMTDNLGQVNCTACLRDVYYGLIKPL